MVFLRRRRPQYSILLNRKVWLTRPINVCLLLSESPVPCKFAIRTCSSGSRCSQPAAIPRILHSQYTTVAEPIIRLHSEQRILVHYSLNDNKLVKGSVEQDFQPLFIRTQSGPLTSVVEPEPVWRSGFGSRLRLHLNKTEEILNDILSVRFNIGQQIF